MGYPAGLFSFSAMKEVKHIRQSSKETMPLATKEEIEIAKDTDLPDLLTYMGYSVKRIGQYYTTREMDSLRIKDRRTWTRYSTRQRGDAITFVQEFCNKSFPEAVAFLLEYHGKARDSPAARQPETVQEKRPPFSLPPAWHDQRRVFAYLRSRGIAPQVITGFVSAGLLYEDALHHNCVFVGRNHDGVPVFANKRSTCTLGGKSFKGDAVGSDKSVAFRLPCDKAKNWVAVFEAPIDLMSFCTLHREVRSNAVALCGLSKGALDTYLAENPHLKRIVFCLDADEPGRSAAAEFREEYEKRGYQVSVREPARGKDWNEYLQQRASSRERGR